MLTHVLDSVVASWSHLQQHEGVQVSLWSWGQCNAMRFKGKCTVSVGIRKVIYGALQICMSNFLKHGMAFAKIISDSKDLPCNKTNALGLK